MGKHADEDQSEDYSQDDQQQKKEIRKPKVDRIDKFKNLKKIVINISMTQYPVVTEVAEALNWKVQESNDAGDWDIYWTDFAIDTDILIKMHLFQKINHYPGMQVLARKNLLGLNLMAQKARFPDQYNFFPLTWMLPSQYAEFRAYYETKPKGKARTYIAKPEHECQGRGIFLTRKIEDLETGKHYVVQRYLARPFLIEGLKFDLRIYVLLCGTNPLRLYMYNEGLGRLATQPYVQPTTSNLEKPFIHLTNYAINKHNPKFIFNNSSNNMGIGHKRSISCIYKQLASMGVNIQQLKQKINDVAVKTIICGLPLMSHQYKCSQPQDYSGNMCFHILGLDIMLNNKGQPILLQVNHTPSFTTDTPLDHQIKFNLIKDTLKLMNINTQTKNDLFNKAKDLNKDRLLTGKRQIFEGKERDDAIKQAQALRDEYEEKNLGGYSKIFPVKDETKMRKYNEIIDSTMKSYFEENGSIRMKLIEKQAKKAAKQDYKQMKTSKAAQQQNGKQTNSQSTYLKSGILKSDAQRQNQKKKNVYQPQKKDTDFDEHQQEESIEQIRPIMTRSENNIQRQNQLKNNLQLVPSLVKKFSEKHQKIIINSNPIIAIKKFDSSYSTQVNQAEATPSKEAKCPKSTSINRAHTKEPNTAQRLISFQNSNQKQRLKSITVSKTNKQNLRQLQNELPAIVDNLNFITNDSHLPAKKQDKLHPLSRQANLRSINRSGKISAYVAKDIRDMLDKKSNNNGNFVMPKILNLNIDSNERRNNDPPTHLLPLKRINLFHSNQ